MLDKCKADIQRLNDEINSIIDYDATIKKRKAEIKKSVDLFLDFNFMLTKRYLLCIISIAFK